MRKYLILSLAAVLLAASCTRTYRAVGDTHLTVFDHAHVQFLPDSLGGFTDADAEGIVHLTNGRIILKKVQLPDYKRKVEVKLTVRVESDGDRWDKSGSVFVIPAKGPKVNILSVAKGEAAWPEVDSTRYEKLVGTVPGPDFEPTAFWYFSRLGSRSFGSDVSFSPVTMPGFALVSVSAEIARERSSPASFQGESSSSVSWFQT